MWCCTLMICFKCKRLRRYSYQILYQMIKVHLKEKLWMLIYGFSDIMNHSDWIISFLKLKYLINSQVSWLKVSLAFLIKIFNVSLRKYLLVVLKKVYRSLNLDFSILNSLQNEHATIIAKLFIKSHEGMFLDLQNKLINY